MPESMDSWLRARLDARRQLRPGPAPDPAAEAPAPSLGSADGGPQGHALPAPVNMNAWLRGRLTTRKDTL